MSVSLSHRLTQATAALAGALLLSACAMSNATVSTAGDADPLEVKNRQMHVFNQKLDKALIRPASQAHTTVISPDLHNSISNFADNLSLPSVVLNNLLQGNLQGATHNTVRFVFNTTLGIGGLFDPAGEIAEMHVVDADFGQTMHVWGVGEGDYLVLPIFGPSNTRDAIGKAVDFAIDPMSGVIPSPEKYIGTAASLMSKVGDRGRYSETVDSILYDSADGYEQARLLYLQNRRFKLGDGDAAEEIDPFALNTEGF